MTDVLTDTAPAIVQLRAELARLRSQIASFEEADRQATDVISRLSDLAHRASEVRRETSLRIAETISACERLVDREQSDYARGLSAMLADLDDAKARAGEFATIVQGMERELGALSDHMAALDANSTNGSTDSAALKPALSEVSSIRHWLTVEQITSARTALSLQRFIADLPFVESVEAREFGNGRLKLEIQGAAAVVPSDLSGWTIGRLMLLNRTADSAIFRLDEPSPANAIRN